jgi:hypothetical protein
MSESVEPLFAPGAFRSEFEILSEWAMGHYSHLDGLAHKLNHPHHPDEELLIEMEISGEPKVVWVNYRHGRMLLTVGNAGGGKVTIHESSTVDVETTVYGRPQSERLCAIALLLEQCAKAVENDEAEALVRFDQG